MDWLQALDTGLFRFINHSLSNPVFDVVMPFASGNRLFIPAVLVAAALLLWKGGARGRLCLLMLLLIVWPGDSFVCNTIKHAVARPRPFVALTDVRLFGKVRPGPEPVAPMGRPAVATDRAANRGGYTSMPSSHAANWFAATMILLVYYRRSWRFMLPLACLVAFSRVYNGVHYPSDVLAGAILGGGYAAAGLWALHVLWERVGRNWFPLWWRQLPSLFEPESGREKAEGRTEQPEAGSQRPSAETQNSKLEIPTPPLSTLDFPLATPSAARIDAHWLRLGYVLIAVLLFLNLAYLGSGLIELSGDEAYQWIWSKHLALSYFSKPPLIAYTQFLGTTLWGDNEFGVRFFSPVISSILGILLLRFFAREVNARAGFFLLLIISATPLLALGSVLMTVDPLSVLFWTAAMVAGWRAVQPEAKTGPWLWTGLWIGLGFLSKYTALFQWLCWAVFFALWRPARIQLRRPGPYLALLINLLCALPVAIWNRQHGWVTLGHVADNASLGSAWHPTLRYFLEFLGKEAGLLNPVFFAAMLWAALAFWRRGRHDARMVYLFSMGAPLFLSYLLYTFHSGVLPNWIAPAVLPLFCLMVIYWDALARRGARGVKAGLIAGLSFGVSLVLLLHDTDLIQKVVGQPLPPKPDPMTRVRGYRQMAELVNEARERLRAEGKPVFIIGAHYATTGLITFYLPEAKTNVTDRPLVYFRSSTRPLNQFYFWPGYREQRKGENAIYVHELPEPPLVHGWIPRWLAGEKHLRRYEPQGEPAPAFLVNEFDSVTNLGLYNALYRGRIFHTIQLFECRNLR